MKVKDHLLRSPAVRALLLLLALAGGARASAPGVLTYQGRLKESGLPVTGVRTVDVQICSDISLPGCTSTGAQSVSVVNGLFRTTFTVPSGVALETGSWFLEVHVGVSVFAPREQLSAGAYAILASSASTLIANPGASYVAISTPVSFGAQDISGYSVVLSSGLNSPAGTVNAKYFVGDGSGLTNVASGAVRKTGDSMTGALNLVGAALNLSGASGVIVSQSSVTAGVYYGDGSHLTNLPASGGSVSKTGDTMTGSLIMLGASTITVNGNAFSVGGSTLVVIGGNVGIGTTSPAAKLHVSSGTVLVDGNAAIGLQVFGSTFVVNSNGNVGIGTTNPAAALAVYSPNVSIAPLNVGLFGDVSPRFQLDSSGILSYGGTSSVGSGGLSVVRLGTGGNVVGSGSNMVAINASGVSSLTANLLNLMTGGVSQMIVQAGGNVGIGTTSPVARLHVSSASAAATDTLFQVSSGTATGQELLVVKGDGRVGVGTTNPGAKLEVAGQVKITGGSPAAGNVLTSDAAGLASWQVPSGGSLLIATNTWSAQQTYLNQVTVSTGLTVSGSVGIGAISPATTLDVNGAAQFGSGAVKSTFTALGSLQVPYGITAGSATFTSGLTASVATFTASGATQYSLVTSSGINVLNSAGVYAGFFVGNGAALTGVTATPGGPAAGDLTGTYPGPTFDLTRSHAWTGAQTFGAASGLSATYGITAGSATLTGGLTASSGTFTQTGNTNFSLQTSSGISVPAGAGVYAGFFVGNGAGLTGISGTDNTKVAKAGDTMTGKLNGTDIGLTYGITAASGTITSTFTVQGSAFSVGGSTLVVTNGNVGIGTTSPGNGTLTVVSTPANGAANITFGAASAVSGSESASLTFSGSGIQHAGFSWVPNLTANNSRMALAMGVSNDPAQNPSLVSFMGSGNVGIGTTAPASLLDVNGNAQFGVGAAKSTFTALGSLQVPYGVSAGSATLTGGLTASSGTFTQTGNTNFSLQTSSGVSVAAGGVTSPFFSGVYYGDGSHLTGVAASNLLASTSTWSAYQTYLNQVSISTDLYMSAGQINLQGNRVTTAAGKLDATQLANVVPTSNVVGAYTNVIGVGTLTAGVWNATAVAPQYGGTGANLSAAAAGGVPYIINAGVMGTVGVGTAGQILQSNAGAAPTWVNAANVTSGLLASTNTWSAQQSFNNLINVSSSIANNGVSALSFNNANTTAAGSLTVGGSAFSVGGTTLAVVGGQVGIGLVPAPISGSLLDVEAPTGWDAIKAGCVSSNCTAMSGATNSSGGIGVFGQGVGNPTAIGVEGSGAGWDFYAQTAGGKSYFAGNVGIGTTGPGAKLDVQDTSATDSYSLRAGTSTTAYQFVVSTTGNVGIGTTSPGAKLEVQAALGFASESGPIMATNATVPAKKISIGYDNTIDAGYISALHSGITWKNLILQGSGGNVGIGTTAPTSHLSILDPGNTIAGQQIRIGNSAGSADYTFGRNPSNGYLDFAGSQTGFIGYTFSGGNVGIGTTNPAALLDVNGTAQFGTGAAKSTFTATGLAMAAGSSVTLSGAGGVIVAQSSVNASAFFGDGSHLTGIATSNLLSSTNTWSAWQTYLNQVSVSTDIYMNVGQINLQGNRVTTVAGKLDATQLSNVVPAGSLSGPYTNVTGVGTLAAGTWNATVVAPTYGGTGQNFSSVGAGAVPYFVGAGVMSSVNSGIAGQVLQSNGTLAPTWVTPVAPSSLLASTNTWSAQQSFANLINISSSIANNGVSALTFISSNTTALGNLTVQGKDVSGYSVTLSSGLNAPAGTIAANIVSASTVSANVLFFGTGIVSQGPGNGTVVGGARGQGANDLQTSRVSATEVAFGQYSVISGGANNTASGTQGATVGGGVGNTASGMYATVPGGSANIASGQNSFAAGANAQANAQGSFVWNDTQGTALTSSINNQFLLRAGGGFEALASSVTIMNNAGTSQLFYVSGSSAIFNVSLFDQGGNLITGAGGGSGWTRTAPLVSLANPTDNVVIQSTLTVQGAVGIGGTGLGNGTLVVVSTSATSGNPVADFRNNIGTSLMQVQQGGRVGIGTSNPSLTLHVASGLTSATMGIDAPNGSAAVLEFLDNGGAEWSFTRWPITDDLHIRNTSLFEYLTILQSNGNVGIGTTAPGALLDVNGTAQFGPGTAKSTFTATGLVMAAGSSITLSGASGFITTLSSINASAFFGDASHLLNGPPDASKVLKAGDVMTGNLFLNTSTLTVNGPIFSTGTSGGVAFSGPGTRFMWVPSSAAIRGGVVNAGQWDPANIGPQSVAFGDGNQASADHTVVAGGSGNTASGAASVVGGGFSNTASGFTAVVPGGQNNSASGYYSFAAGRQAKANANGNFVWADSAGVDLISTIQDQFLVRAQGGFDIQSSSFIFANAVSTFVFIQSNGNVGIGTMTPTGKLHIAGNIDAPQVIVQMNSPQTAASQQWINGGGTVVAFVDANGGYHSRSLSGEVELRGAVGGIGMMGTVLNTDLALETNGAEKARITAAGNVGIGTLVPTNTLDISGDMILRSSMTFAGILNPPFNAIAGQGAIYFDTILHKFMVSENGGGYTSLLGGGGSFVAKAGDTMTGNLSLNTSTLTVNGPIFSTGTSGGTSFSGAGTRFMWVPSSAAIRGGVVSGNVWDPANIGLNSVAFGQDSKASGSGATVGGGFTNWAIADYATIAGGYNNMANGFYATVPGGQNNTATGQYAFAAGYFAKALANGSFVWADTAGGLGAPLTASIQDQFLARAMGGFDVQSSSFIFANGVSTYVYIQNSGNVGIGTTSPATLLDVNGTAQFGSGAAKSTFTLTGLAMAAGSSVTLSGVGGVIVTQSSITAGTYYGDGSHLTGIATSNLLSSTNTWSAWQTYLNQVSVSTDIYMNVGQINLQGNRVTTALGKLDAGQLANTVPAAIVVGPYINMTGVGTLSAGTWNATVVAPAYGGTGANLTAGVLGGVPYFMGPAGIMAALPPGTAGQVLQSNGAGAPAWVTPTNPSVLLASTNTWSAQQNYLNQITVSTGMTISGNVGIGTTGPTNRLDISGGGMILRSSMTLVGMAAPPVSAAGQGAIYFDSAGNRFMMSQSGGNYVLLGARVACLTSSLSFCHLTTR